MTNLNSVIKQHLVYNMNLVVKHPVFLFCFKLVDIILEVLGLQKIE